MSRRSVLTARRLDKLGLLTPAPHVNISPKPSTMFPDSYLPRATAILRRRRNYKTRSVIIAIIILSALSGAQAKIGETLPQLIKRFGNKYQVEEQNNGDITYKFVGGYFMNAILRNGVCVTEIYFSDHALENGEPPTKYVRGVLNVEAPGRKWTEQKPSIRADYAVASDDGKYWAELAYKRQRADRFTWSMAVYYVPALMNQPEAQEPTSPPAWAVTPTSVATPFPVMPTLQPTPIPMGEHHYNDCLIVSTKVYNELKGKAYWCEIVGLSIKADGETSGHAVVVYQMEKDGLVYAYDPNLGSLFVGANDKSIATISKGLQYQWKKHDVPWTITNATFTTGPEAGKLIAAIAQSATYAPATETSTATRIWAGIGILVLGGIALNIGLAFLSFLLGIFVWLFSLLKAPESLNRKQYVIRASIACLMMLLPTVGWVTVARDSRWGAIALLIVAILVCYYLYACVVAPRLRNAGYSGNWAWAVFITVIILNRSGSPLVSIIPFIWLAFLKPVPNPAPSLDQDATVGT